MMPSSSMQQSSLDNLSGEIVKSIQDRGTDEEKKEIEVGAPKAGITKIGSYSYRNKGKYAKGCRIVNAAAKKLTVLILILSLSFVCKAQTLHPAQVTTKDSLFHMFDGVNARLDSLYVAGLKAIRHDCFWTFRFGQYVQLNRKIKHHSH
jgi:hypothetical protein